MKKQNILLATIFSVLAILLVLPVMSAAVMTSVINNPLNFTNHTGTMVANCTTSVHNVINVTFNGTNTAGVNSTIGIITNTTPTQTAWYSATMSVTGVTDGIDYNVSCFADNGTDQQVSTWNKNITFDSTSPVCSLSRTHSKFAWKDTQLITWSATDAVSLVSTAVDVDGPEDQTTLQYTDTSRALTLTSQDTKYVGDWTANMTGTDRPGNTCTASATFKSYMPGEVDEEPTEPTDRAGKLLLLAIIVGIIWWISSKKK